MAFQQYELYVTLEIG